MDPPFMSKGVLAASNDKLTTSEPAQDGGPPLAGSFHSAPVSQATMAGATSPAGLQISTADSSVTSKTVTANASPSLLKRTPSQSSAKSGCSQTHRLSFAENLRNIPTSPHAQKHPSFSQATVNDLLSHPPAHNRNPNPRFTGRDWREITAGELVSTEDVRWVNMSTSVEDATKALLRSGHTHVVLIRKDDEHRSDISTFDYSDLNAYLLVVVGLARADDEQQKVYAKISTKAHQGQSIPLREIQPICRKNPLISLKPTDNLGKAIEILGSGIHQVLILDQAGEVAGILNQLRLVEFFWNEGVHFATIDQLYPVPLRDLGIGNQKVVSVDSDRPLADALLLILNEGLTSVAVVDDGLNVVGNISTVDVQLLTSSTRAPLLDSSCMHFISVILTERGLEQGRDSFPVFHVYPHSTLAHTVAKLVATRSHRMWIVEGGPSPAYSAPATPLLSHSPASTATSHPASALPGAHLSGLLCGVVSLTDVLNIFAKSSGLHPGDPTEPRARRRRSSSSSEPYHQALPI